MNGARWRRIVVVAAVVALVWTAASSRALRRGLRQAHLRFRAEMLKRAYREAETPVARRTVAIRAIDEGVIGDLGDRQTTDVVDSIFGTTPRPDASLLANVTLDPSWKSAWDLREHSDLALRVVTLGNGSSASAFNYLVVIGGNRAVPSTDRRFLDNEMLGSYLCNCTYAGLLWWSGGESAAVWQRVPPAGATPAVHPGETSTQKRAVEALRVRYIEARTEDVRRSILLEALDGGVIQQGTPMATMDRIFGTSCATSADEGCVVEFLSRREVPGTGGSERLANSWYFGAAQDDSGRIDCYWLSSTHFKNWPIFRLRRVD